MGTLSVQRRRGRKRTAGGTLPEMSGTLTDSAGNPARWGCCLPLREMAEKNENPIFSKGMQSGKSTRSMVLKGCVIPAPICKESIFPGFLAVRCMPAAYMGDTSSILWTKKGTGFCRFLQISFSFSGRRISAADRGRC